VAKRQYGAPQNFYWQEPLPFKPHRFKQLTELSAWQRQAHARGNSPWSLSKATGKKASIVWEFYFGAALTLPLLLALGAARAGWAALVCVAAFLGSALYPFFYPHYVAPCLAVFMFLCAEGLRRLWNISWRRGAGAALALTLFLAATVVSWGPGGRWTRRRPPEIMGRFVTEERLRALGGKHLVFVRYPADHDFFYEWVYNRADIDHAAVVWAREIDPRADAKLLQYFRDRSVWVVEAGISPAKLIRPAKPQVTGAARGPERSSAGIQ
jgi:hypothetical protein